MASGLPSGCSRSSRPTCRPTGTQQVDAATTTIRVRDLGVAFGDRVAVADASFEILPGRVTAMVGPSGCGKSTILSVLLGLVGPPTATVDGRVEVVDSAGRASALGDLDLGAWRAQIGWVPQAPAMLGGSVADNVRFGRTGFAEAQVASALAAAGLALEELPNGLSTAITEGGAGVSVGQARRIGVARALLADPAILLFDEPTAALDGTREAEIGATVADLAATGRTVVVVTHRQSLVDLADDVIVLAPAEAGAQLRSGAATGTGAPTGAGALT